MLKIAMKNLASKSLQEFLKPGWEGGVPRNYKFKASKIFFIVIFVLSQKGETFGRFVFGLALKNNPSYAKANTSEIGGWLLINILLKGLNGGR